MKKKIHRRNRRHRFLLSRKFATILIGLGFGLTFMELLLLCWFDWRHAVVGGAMFGTMLACYYNGIMIDLQQERERQRTYQLRRSRRSA